MIKKITAVLLALTVFVTAFCACGENGNKSDRLKIVCTVFPYYDWVRNIVKDTENYDLVLLLDSGTDPHSFQPSAADIVTVSTADIFIYTGGESDSWVEDVLKTSKGEDTEVLKLTDCLGEERLLCVEESNETQPHTHENGHSADEHIWLSLKNAAKLAEIITEKIIEKDTENKDLYEKNCKEYTDELLLLNATFERIIFSSGKKTLVFADRFPFIYLTEDYGLNYLAAFPGCSAESEASFETVTRLAGKIDELDLSYILITETSDGAVAKTVRNSTKAKNQEILTVNSIQSVTEEKLSSSYIEIMEENLSVLTKALS